MMREEQEHSWRPFMRRHLVAALRTFLRLLVVLLAFFVFGMFGMIPVGGPHAEEAPLLFLFLSWTILPLALVMTILAFPVVVLVKCFQNRLRLSWKIPAIVVFPLTFAVLFFGQFRFDDWSVFLCSFWTSVILTVPFVVYWMALHTRTRDIVTRIIERTS